MDKIAGMVALALVFLCVIAWLVWLVRTARAAGLREVVRTMAIALLGGLMTGLCAAGIARLTMRIVALAGFGTPRMTVEGTIEILRQGIYGAMAVNLLLLIARKYLRGSRCGEG